MTRPHRSPPSALPAPLALLLACTPMAKSVGDDLDGGSPSESGEESSGEEGSGDAGSGDGAVGSDFDPAVPEWTQVLPTDLVFVKIAATPDGGVAAIRHRRAMLEHRVLEYAADGSLDWESDLYESQLDDVVFEANDLVARHDGTIVIGGATLIEGRAGAVATIWELPGDGGVGITIFNESPRDRMDDASVTELAAFGNGIVYLVREWNDREAPFIELRFNDGFGSEEGWNDVPGPFHDVALLASGDIATLELNSKDVGTDVLRTFTPHGELASEQVVPIGAFASDQPLVRLEYLDDGSTRLVADASGLDVTLPGVPSAVSHGPGVAIVAPTEDGAGIAVIQLDALGNELRAAAVPAPGGGTVTPLDVAIAPDGSVYVAGTEQEPTRTDGPGPVHGFILKLPPP
jgi:hypothetical protein